jgi:nucleotide-binding universal stress UspA family protein
MYRNMLVATDLTEASMPAMRAGRDLAARLGAELTLLHVCETVSPRPWYGDLSQGEMALFHDIARRRRQEAETALREQALRADVRDPHVLVSAGLPGDMIAEIAKERGVDLIVIGTHGRTGIGHLLLGSVAERTVRRAPCAVLTVRAKS